MFDVAQWRKVDQFVADIKQNINKLKKLKYYIIPSHQFIEQKVIVLKLNTYFSAKSGVC